MKYDLSEINAVIRDRRTIYPEQYSDRVVHEEIVRELLTNATWAPTHGKTQPWKFIVFSGDGRKKLMKIVEDQYRNSTSPADFNEKKLERTRSRIEKSSVLILLVMNRTLDSKIPEIEEIEAVACAAQNILLTATAHGLGAFWSSPKYFYSPEANAAFDLKPEDLIQGIIYLGYPNRDWPKSHRKPIEYITDWVN